jgi:hypothetical protein
MPDLKLRVFVASKEHFVVHNNKKGSYTTYGYCLPDVVEYNNANYIVPYCRNYSSYSDIPEVNAALNRSVRDMVDENGKFTEDYASYMSLDSGLVLAYANICYSRAQSLGLEGGKSQYLPHSFKTFDEYIKQEYNVYSEHLLTISLDDTVTGCKELMESNYQGRKISSTVTVETIRINKKEEILLSDSILMGLYNYYTASDEIIEI